MAGPNRIKSPMTWCEITGDNKYCTMRNFIQTGLVIGSQPVQVRIQLDDHVLFDGDIKPHVESVAEVDYDAYANWPTLFTWQHDYHWSGQQTLHITCQGGSLVLGVTYADHSVPGDNSLRGLPMYQTVGDRVFSDPFSEINIDGMFEIKGDNAPTGQYLREIASGQTFTCQVTIQAGVSTQEWRDDVEYVPGMFVTHAGLLYRVVRGDNDDYQIGTPVTNTRFFKEIPRP